MVSPIQERTTMRNVVFKPEDWRRLEEYTSLCPVEIACMGYATLEEGNVVVDEIFLVPQVISLSSVDFLSKGFPWAVKKAIKEDRVNELRFCWHSHATHGAYFSGTDEDMVRKVRDSGPIPWFASCVLNKKGETHAQLDYFQPEGELADFTKHVIIELDVHVDGRQEATEERTAEIEEFTERKHDYDAKQKKSKPKKAGESILPLEPVETNKQWTGTITARDRALHKLAKKHSWECYIHDDVAYYWCSETREFKGSAPIPIVISTGEYEIDIDATVIDSTATEEDGDTAELIPIDEAENALLEQAMNAGQL